MEDKDKNIETQQVELKKGSGSLLAAARKKQNRTVEEIADELNLSVSQIKTIELDQSEGLPEPTYVRGYIRSYAKLLGLNEERILEHYLNPNWQKSTSLEDMPKGIGSAENSEASGFFSPAKVIVLLVLLVSLAFLWYSGLLASLIGSNDSSRNSVAPVTEASASGPQPGVVSSSSVDELPTGIVANNLVLNFSQTTWVDIRDVDIPDNEGNILAYKSYTEGEELNVSSAGQMSVFIGNAEGVTAKFNGEDLDISQYRQGVYAKFVLGEK